MRNGRLLFSAVEFIIVAAFSLLGAAFFYLYYLPSARESLSNWILIGGNFFCHLGCLTSTIAIVLGVCFWMMQRGRFIRLKSSGVTVSEEAVRTAVQTFWKDELADEQSPSEIFCAKNHIEVITPVLKEDLEEVEKRLGVFLSRRLGYDREFFLSIKMK